MSITNKSIIITLVGFAGMFASVPYFLSPGNVNVVNVLIIVSSIIMAYGVSMGIQEAKQG